MISAKFSRAYRRLRQIKTELEFLQKQSAEEKRDRILDGWAKSGVNLSKPLLLFRDRRGDDLPVVFEKCSIQENSKREPDAFFFFRRIDHPNGGLIDYSADYFDGSYAAFNLTSLPCFQMRLAGM